MSDPASIWDAVKIGGGTVVGAVVAAFVKNFFSGDAGAQARDLRDGLSDRVTQVETQNALLATRISLLELRLEDSNRQRDEWRYRTFQARIIADSLAARHGEPINVWPADPLLPGGTP